MLDAEDYFASRGLASYSKTESTPIFGLRDASWHHFVPTGVWYTVTMIIEFKGEIFYWRGPAPFLFVAIPEDPSRDLKAISARVTYGWGVIPVHVRIGKTEWQTSLFPKDGRYLVPIRMSVQKSENLEVGDSVVIQVEVR
jgi:hypothetical protein